MARNNNTNKGRAIKRVPIRTTLEPIRTLFEHMDEHHIPYAAVETRVCRENLHKYRHGHRGCQLYTLIEWADILGFDIVAVPRQHPLQQGSTPATPQLGDRTHSAGGMVPATAAPVGLAA